MYVNRHFVERELGVLHDMIEAARFGVLVLCADGPLAAHIPFVLRRDEGRYGTLCAHLAANDPLARHLGSGAQALAIFAGPRAYISPRWYPGGGLPTYNYFAVHAYGHPRPVRNRTAVLRHLAELVDVHEQRSAAPWSITQAAHEHVVELSQHIAAFELPIDAIQGKRKLSQNRSAENRAGVISGLREQGGEDELAIAEAMVGYAYASAEEQSLIAPPDGSRWG